MSQIQPVALHEAARYRYLNYAISVITSRALPDVRDGLKPVQRRILYAMYHNLHLYPEARYRKSAAVVGEVMAKYHPHGDSSIYDAMVRMAQPFSLLHPLVDGQGNFGSMDGDNAAAMRYTEAKLSPLSMELLTELKQRTIDYRPNYDGQQFEPIVLPAQFPNLLINGTEGIAVGMATKIPPHNFREVIDACVLLIDDPEVESAALARKVRGPDFPTGGMILNSKNELREVYATGQGAVRIRGCWELEKDGRRNNVIITEIPYAVNKAVLVEKIGDIISSRKLPQVVDIRDESTEKVRVVLALRGRSGIPPQREMDQAMAYLCRHTSLQLNIHMNMTCLVPTANPEVSQPIKTHLRELLRHWLAFRRQTVRKRFLYVLEKLKERIHLLEAFAEAFEVLDEVIAIIRASEGRRDAHEKLMDRFSFDDKQTEAILDLRLYKLAKLEIWAIMDELNEKQAEAARIEEILSATANIWAVVRSELLELRKLYGRPRRTKIGGEDAVISIEDDSAYIVDEDTYVIVTRAGWIKRQGRFSSIKKIRLRDGDSILCVAKARTRTTIAFFTSQGTVYVMRVADIPHTTGYGDPLQRYFSFSDGERVIGAIAMDGRALPSSGGIPVEDPEYPPPYGIGVTEKGRTVRFSLKAQQETTNKTGRKYMKPEKTDDSVLAVYAARGDEWVSLASQRNVLCFPVSEITLVRGAGKGVYAIKLAPKDKVIAFELTSELGEGVLLSTPKGREVCIRPRKYAGRRAARGSMLLKRGQLDGWVRPLLRYDLLNRKKEEDSEEGSFSEEESTEDQSTDMSTTALPLPSAPLPVESTPKDEPSPAATAPDEPSPAATASDEPAPPAAAPKAASDSESGESPDSERGPSTDPTRPQSGDPEQLPFNFFDE
jgi:DNA gyrase subunit A